MTPAGGGYGPPPGWVGGGPPGGGDGPPRVFIGWGGGTNRLTVFFRALLAFPHMFVYGVVSWAAIVCAIGGWFASLVTGELPRGIDRFLRGYITYGARTYAYLGLLTDQYPPFSLPEEGAYDYPVRVVFAPRRPVNRVTVLFRLVLAIPAVVVASVAYTGAGVAAFFMWAATLITGHTPRPVRDSLGAVLRYHVRLLAYLGLVTQSYPVGLFTAGDDDLEVAALRAQPRDIGSVDVVAVRSPVAVKQSSGGTALVVIFLVLGLLYGVIVQVPTFLGLRDRARDTAAMVSLSADYNQLGSQMVAFQQGEAGCRTSPNPPLCVRQVSDQATASLDAFAAQVHQISFRPVDQADANALSAVATSLGSDISDLASGGGAPALRQLAADGATLDQDYRQLVTDLHTPR